MALAETAKLVASLELKDKFSKGLSSIGSGLGKFENRITKSHAVSTAFGVGLERVATASLRKLGSAVTGGLGDLAELETAVTSVDGAIRQVGLTGRVTGAQVATWANDIEANIGAAFDDKEIVASAATLIRFGKVTTDNLRPALEVMTDLAVKTGSVDSAASLLAKALADPEKAAGKLARSGVILTKEQQKQIKVFVKAGKVAQAQKVILDELTKTTKGAAAASQGPYKRALSVLADVTEDAQKALATGFLPVIEKVAKLLSGELAKPGTLDNIRKFGEGLASGLDNLIDIARGLPWGMIGDSLRLAGTGAKTVLDAFLAIPPWVQTAILTGWGLNKLTGGAIGDIVGELAKGLVKGVLGMNAGVVNINAGVVNGGGPGIPGPSAPTGLSAAAKVFLVGEAIGLGLLVNEVRTGVETAATTQATGIKAVSDAQIAQGKSQGELRTALAGVEQGIASLKSDPLGVILVSGSALEALESMKANLVKAIGNSNVTPNTSRSPDDRNRHGTGGKFRGGLSPEDRQTKNDAAVAAANKTTTAVETMRGNLSTVFGKATDATGAVRDELTRTTSAAATSGKLASSAALVSGAGIQNAIRANRPITNVDIRISGTSVQKSVTVQTRYGNPGGDRDSGGGNLGGPGGPR